MDQVIVIARDHFKLHVVMVFSLLLATHCPRICLASILPHVSPRSVHYYHCHLYQRCRRHHHHNHHHHQQQHHHHHHNNNQRHHHYINRDDHHCEHGWCCSSGSCLPSYCIIWWFANVDQFQLVAFCFPGCIPCSFVQLLELQTNLP